MVINASTFTNGYTSACHAFGGYKYKRFGYKGHTYIFVCYRDLYCVCELEFSKNVLELGSV